MLRFMTKEDVWSAMDAGFLHTDDWTEANWRRFSIKQMQDAVLLSMLNNPEGLDILEVGGGHSRTLPHLVENNRCTNADPVEGSGHGPVGVDPDAVKWRHVFRAMGDTSEDLADASFDVVYSISVIEHVDTADFPRVFGDMARVLRPGGRMIHLVDTYLQDFDRDNAWGLSLCNPLRAILLNGLVQATGDILSNEDVFFRGAYATNPDTTMRVWNQMAPEIAPVRLSGQACSYIFEARKP